MVNFVHLSKCVITYFVNKCNEILKTCLADGEEPIVSDTEEYGSSAKIAQSAAEEAAAKIMPPPPTPPVALHKVPVLSSTANKMHQIAPKVCSHN